MPKIVINEIDLTTYLNRSNESDHIVLVAGYRTNSDTTYDNEFTLVRSLRDFYNKFGSTPPSNSIYEEYVGWKFATGLLVAGFPVLYYCYGEYDVNNNPHEVFSNNLEFLEDKINCRVKFIPTIYDFNKSGTQYASVACPKTIGGYIGYYLFNGTDYVKVTYDNISSSDINVGPEVYDLDTEKLIFNKVGPFGSNEEYIGKYYKNSSNNYIELNASNVSEYITNPSTKCYQLVSNAYESLLSLLNDRGDCLAFVDFVDANLISGDEDNIVTLAANIVSSYEVVAFPAAKSAESSEYLMPASYWMLKTMAEGVYRGLPIYSTWAGQKRGTISGVKEFTTKVSYQAMEKLTDNAAIIPLMNLGSLGDVIYGNNTRNHVGTIDTPPAVKSALDSVNVRLTANEIKRYIFDICLSLSFDSNTEQLWGEFYRKLSPILDGMVSGGALRDYRIIMDETTVTNSDIDALTVNGVVTVDITRAAEKFNIDFRLVPTGAIVSDNI